MAKKTNKKVNPKDVAKKAVMDVITEALENAGMSVEDGTDYGFTKGTVVIHAETCDIQLKPIAPKSGVDRYEKGEEEGE
jgi:N-acetylglucosamine kinase-like BadF-type ATPase